MSDNATTDAPDKPEQLDVDNTVPQGKTDKPEPPKDKPVASPKKAATATTGDSIVPATASKPVAQPPDIVATPPATTKEPKDGGFDVKKIQDLILSQIDNRLKQVSETNEKKIFFSQNPDIQNDPIINAAFNGIVEKMKKDEDAEYATLEIMQKASDSLGGFRGYSTNPVPAPNSIRDIDGNKTPDSIFEQLDQLKGKKLADAFQALSAQERNNYLASQ